jgi:hypothetical protein
VGRTVGAGVGLVVGDAVGFGVGVNVGEAVGFGVGVNVGDGVGASVGAGVGLGVGAAVGIASHTSAFTLPAVHFPVGQSWHTWYRSWSWYLPDGQGRQLVWAVQAL